MGYFSVLWQNVLKIFFIDLLAASMVLASTALLALVVYVAGHLMWGLRLHAVSESILILAIIYLLVIVATAIKRQFYLGFAVTPNIGVPVSSQPEAPNAKSAPTVDAGISSPISRS